MIKRGANQYLMTWTIYALFRAKGRGNTVHTVVIPHIQLRTWDTIRDWRKEIIGSLITRRFVGSRLTARMEHIVCSNPSEFDATLSKALAVDKPCFVLFTGNLLCQSLLCPRLIISSQGQRIQKRENLGVQTVLWQNLSLIVNLKH